MCLIVLAWKAHPDCPLVVAANRDEFFARPAVPAHWWTDAPDVLAGRDLVGNGTWLGMTREGRFAALTNYRDPTLRREGTPSRGALVSEALASRKPVIETLQDVAAVSARYSAFNLLLGDGRELGIHESTTGRVYLLEPGIHGLSNHLLGTPWPKVRLARERFATALEQGMADDDFLALLRDDRPAPDGQLPSTGVDPEWERLLSPAFIRAPGYGTRSSTVLRVHRSGEVHFREWTWTSDGTAASDVTHRYATPPHLPLAPSP